jgi:hypothetical protein
MAKGFTTISAMGGAVQGSSRSSPPPSSKQWGEGSLATAMAWRSIYSI